MKMEGTDKDLPAEGTGVLSGLGVGIIGKASPCGRRGRPGYMDQYEWGWRLERAIREPGRELLRPKRSPGRLPKTRLQESELTRRDSAPKSQRPQEAGSSLSPTEKTLSESPPLCLK